LRRIVTLAIRRGRGPSAGICARRIRKNLFLALIVFGDALVVIGHNDGGRSWSSLFFLGLLFFWFFFLRLFLLRFFGTVAESCQTQAKHGDQPAHSPPRSYSRHHVHRLFLILKSQ